MWAHSSTTSMARSRQSLHRQAGSSCKRGGTAGKAPLGYRNTGQLDDSGAEIRTVIVDPERGPLMREAFRLYATGEWTVASLAEHLRALGLTTQPGPSLPSRPITEGLLHKLLTNP